MTPVNVLHIKDEAVLNSQRLCFEFPYKGKTIQFQSLCTHFSSSSMSVVASGLSEKK